jgi:hypothetical protein
VIDLNKPIRWIGTRNPAVISETITTASGPCFVVRWPNTKAGTLGFVAATFSQREMERDFENIPPEPRRVTVWPVWAPSGFSFSTSEMEHAVAVASKYGWRVGKPVEIVEEYP